MMMSPVWFKVGDQVKVLSGYYAGRVGVIINVDKSHVRPFEVEINGLPKGSSYCYAGFGLSLTLELVSETEHLKLYISHDVLNDIKKWECKVCKGTGRLLMLNNYVACDCQTNIGVDQ